MTFKCSNMTQVHRFGIFNITIHAGIKRHQTLLGFNPGTE